MSSVLFHALFLPQLEFSCFLGFPLGVGAVLTSLLDLFPLELQGLLGLCADSTLLGQLLCIPLPAFWAAAALLYNSGLQGRAESQSVPICQEISVNFAVPWL